LDTLQVVTAILKKQPLRGRMKRFIVLATALLLLAGCGSGTKMPVQVEKKKTLRWTILKVKATADDVMIENIIINGGNCQAPPDQYENKKLKSSESVSVTVFGCTNVTAVQVVTKTGSYDFSF
jgi:PBP1b-binding outer membrane lipoprotein LpoB